MRIGFFNQVQPEIEGYLSAYSDYTSQAFLSARRALTLDSRKLYLMYESESGQR